MPRTPPRRFGAHLEQKNIRTKVDTNTTTIHKGINSSMHKYSFLFFFFFFFLKNKTLSREISLPPVVVNQQHRSYAVISICVLFSLSPSHPFMLCSYHSRQATAQQVVQLDDARHVLRAMWNSFTIQRNTFREEMHRKCCLSNIKLSLDFFRHYTRYYKDI